MPARPSLNTEQSIYLAILLVAVALRFGNLDGLPFNELEAQAALPAHQLAQNQPADLGSQPGYTLLAALTFFVLPSSEFLARFWPALAGCALVLLPYFWRDVLGRSPALLLSFALALDPGFVAVSRLASGRALAVFGVAYAITAWRYKRPALAGVLAALALLAAPTVYIALLGAAFVVLLFFQDRIRLDANSLRTTAISAAAFLVLGGTLFFRIPSGLGGIGATLGEFVDGLQNTGAPLVQVLFALATYGLPALVFGLIGAVRGWRTNDSLGKILSLIALVDLVIVLVYPGRQVADLVWVLLPLWALAASEIARYLYIPTEEPRAAAGEAGLMLLLIAFFVFALAKVALNEEIPELSQPFLFVAGGVVLLAIAASVLIAFGWSRPAAVNGSVWALGLFAILTMLSNSTRLQRGGPLAANDMWTPGTTAGDTSLIAQTLEDLSYWQTGEPRDVSVDLRVDSAALSWLVRNFPPAGNDLVSPTLIITAADVEPAEADSYRGQSFVLAAQPAWTLPPNFFGWLLYRSSPVTRQQAILWANLGAFPDGAASLPQAVAP